ncbi:hypothetical protein HYV84_02450 [Candidatus Woesearchaeota archaeon]|nr:hypothetical protein [Candidatus Woesearchaeota archaeon]
MIKTLEDLKKIPDFKRFDEFLKFGKELKLVHLGNLAEFYCEELFSIKDIEKEFVRNRKGPDGYLNGEPVEIRYRNIKSKKESLPGFKLDKNKIRWLYYVTFDDNLFPDIICRFDPSKLKKGKKGRVKGLRIGGPGYEMIYSKDGRNCDVVKPRNPNLLQKALTPLITQL